MMGKLNNYTNYKNLHAEGTCGGGGPRKNVCSKTIPLSNIKYVLVCTCNSLTPIKP